MAPTTGVELILGEGIAYPSPLYDTEIQEGQTKEKNSEDKHLRSMDEVIGYHIQTLDGWLGHVADFIINDETWTIRYIVVDTRNWLPGKKVLLSPNWIDATNWAQRKVHLDVTSQQVRDCPEYDPAAPVNREYEARLYDFYGRPKYW